MGWVSNAIDTIVDAFSPSAGARRRLMRQYGESFRGSRRTRLRTQAGPTGHADAINELTYDREEQLNVARELERDNSLACTLLDRYVDNVVKVGFVPQAMTDDPEWNKQAEQLWRDWAEAPDVRGIDSFGSLLRLVARSRMRDGDVGCILVDTGKYAGKIQLVESDQIVSPPGRFIVDQTIVDGVELDTFGRPVKFHLLNNKYDRQSATRAITSATIQIPADKFIFLARRSRIGQTRGVSVFAQIAWLVEQISKVLEAVTVNARMAACFGVVVTKPGGFPGLPQVTGANDQTYGAFSLEPAMIKVLEQGEDIKTISPSQPSQNLADFVRLLVQFAGVAFSFPLELALLDFSQSNYSSARGGLLQAQRAFRAEQAELEPFCRNVYRWKVAEWMASGALAPREDASRHRWLTPGWDWIDPMKEAEADLLARDAGFCSLTDLMAARGKDFDQTMERIAAENEVLARLGIKLSRSNKSRDVMPEPEETGNEDEENADEQEQE